MGPGFAALAANAPVLNDAGSRVSQLQKLGSAGLEALQYLQSGKSAPSEWKDAQLALIKQAQTPDASFLKLPWLNSYRVLILAAAERAACRTPTASNGSRRSSTKQPGTRRRRSTPGRQVRAKKPHDCEPLTHQNKKGCAHGAPFMSAGSKEMPTCPTGTGY